jgi:hypothetical protein
MQNALSPDSPVQTLVEGCIATWTRVQHKVGVLLAKRAPCLPVLFD